MAINKSVQAFIKLTDDMRDEVRNIAITNLHQESLKLAELMRQLAPVHAGKLRTSIKVIPGKKPTVARIVAGSAETISGEARPYNYARADEFGTKNMPAHPFFFPAYRLTKPKIVALLKRRIVAAVKKRSS